MKTEPLPMCRGEQRHRSYGERRRHRDLQETEPGQRMLRAIALDENNLKRIAHRANHHQQVTAIEIGDSLARYGEAVESCQRCESASPCPSADSAPPEERHQDGNQNYAE